MAVYDGFFDAVQDEDSGEYDRAYSSGDFTEYFEQVVGSGVCVANNPDSFLVRLEDGKAIVGPGYLFIRGYWCKNDADYAIHLPGTGNYAIAAHLDSANRMIELVAQSVQQAYVDTLVLAIVSPTAAEDTRYNTDICGVINTAGELSTMVEWAVHYIDSEIESKLAAVETDIEAQAASLDAKIAEVEAVVSSIEPPAIGTIKFSASQDVSEAWLKCDGSFVSETDYPELVAALGKLSPGVDEFSVLYTDDANGLISNSVVYSGKLWAYFVAQQKLIGFDSNGNKTEISVSGADALVNSAASPVVLSLCGGSMYLAQEVQSTFTFLECASANLSGNSIKMTDCTSALSGKVGTLSDRDLAYPSVSDVNGTKYMALGTTSAQAALVVSSASYTSDFLNVLIWTAGSLSGGTVKTYEFRLASANSSSNADLNRTVTEHMSRTLLGFHAKNHAELVMAFTYIMTYGASGSYMWGYASPYSIPLGTFGLQSNVKDGYHSSKDSWTSGGLTWEKFYTDNYNLSLNTLAVSANDECLYSVQIIDGALWLMYGSYNPVKANVIAQAEGISLPSRAKLFPESVCYLDYQSLWMIFLGTGIAFSTKLDGGTWGYLDTSDVLGVITANGCLTYDADTNVLYVSGTTSSGVPKIAKMYLHDLYDYANDGAWLPLIASDGVPAYIKAKEET